eukprot:1745785-Pyramimonas_sp.AAC.1
MPARAAQARLLAAQSGGAADSAALPSSARRWRGRRPTGAWTRRMHPSRKGSESSPRSQPRRSAGGQYPYPSNTCGPS